MRIVPIIALAVLLLPFIVSAQPIIDPSNCSGFFDFVTPDKARYCTLCDGLQAVKDGLTLLEKIAVAIAGLIIAYGGILIMISGANPGKFEEGKKAIIGSMVGIAMITIAWLVINELFFVFVTQDVTKRPWNKIPCSAEPAGFGAPPPGAVGGGGEGGGGSPQLPPGTAEAEDGAVRGQIAALDPRISYNGDCPQTCVGGLSNNAIQGVADFQKKCNCQVVITAGTEIDSHKGGPASHLSGDKLDLRTGNQIDSYITGNFTPMPNRGDGAIQYKDPSTGYVYANEGDHWDVLYLK